MTGVDEVGVGFRHVEQLLLARHQSQAGQSPAPHGDHGLHGLESQSQGITPGIQEGKHTLQSVLEKIDQAKQGGMASRPAPST